MPTFNGPVQLSNIFKPKIWGRHSLEPLFELPAPADSKGASNAGERIGEVWVTDDTSRFLNGPTAGMTLAEASEKFGAELHGSSWKGKRFPLLAKYIFTSDWLSVQVHPDDAYATAHDNGSLGKCEMWYFLSTDSDAAILLGLKPGVTKDQLLPAFKGGKSREILHLFKPEPEEAAYLAPGLVHALGPGLVVFEVEENSDITYRLDDFNRPGLDGKPRDLHLEKGLDVIRPEMPPLRNLPKLEFKEKYGTRRFVNASRYFALEELSVRQLATFQSTPDRVEVLSIIEGEGRLENEAGWLGYRSGDTWLIPPAAGAYRMVPADDTKFLKFYVPDIQKDFIEPLKQRKVPTEKIHQIVFD
jgi:mannose-6-phosphate isomerase